MLPSDVPSDTIQDALRFERPPLIVQAACYRGGICPAEAHGRHHLHVPSTDSVTLHGAEFAWDSASDAIVYQLAVTRSHAAWRSAT